MLPPPEPLLSCISKTSSTTTCSRKKPAYIAATWGRVANLHVGNLLQQLLQLFIFLLIYRLFVALHGVPARKGCLGGVVGELGGQGPEASGIFANHL